VVILGFGKKDMNIPCTFHEKNISASPYKLLFIGWTDGHTRTHTHKICNSDNRMWHKS